MDYLKNIALLVTKHWNGWNHKKTRWSFTIESVALSLCFQGQKGPLGLGYEDKCEIKAAVILCHQSWVTVDGHKSLENQKIGPGS